MGQIAEPLSAIGVWKGYIETAMAIDTDCPTIQGILAKSWPICQRPRRPAFRTLIAAKVALFLPHL